MGQPQLGNIEIELNDVSKRFGRQWVIKNFSATYLSDNIYGIRGRNGSGKSTLLRLLSAQLSPSRGRVIHREGERLIDTAEVYRSVSWAGPYLEIVEELTVEEMLEFHFLMQPALDGMSAETILDRIGLAPARRRKIVECSSGMRQRVLLATALYAKTSIVLLDEPTVTLDKEAAEWFQAELEAVAGGRLVVIASNDERDLQQCQQLRTL